MRAFVDNGGNYCKRWRGRKILHRFAIILVALGAVFSYVQPISAKAPHHKQPQTVCKVPDYVSYAEQYRIKDITFSQYEHSDYFVDAKYYKFPNFDTGKERQELRTAMRCFFFTLNQYGITQPFKKPVQLRLLRRAAYDPYNEFYLWGHTHIEQGAYKIYLYQAYIYKHPKKAYYNLFHELGHIIAGNRFTKSDYKQYRKLRKLGSQYKYAFADADSNRDYSVNELLADDIAKALLPRTLWPDILKDRGTLKTKSARKAFKKFLIGVLNRPSK